MAFTHAKGVTQTAVSPSLQKDNCGEHDENKTQGYLPNAISTSV